MCDGGGRDNTFCPTIHDGGGGIRRSGAFSYLDSSRYMWDTHSITSYLADGLDRRAGTAPVPRSSSVTTEAKSVGGVGSKPEVVNEEDR